MSRGQWLSGGRYLCGSPTTVQAWRPCPLWEPSPSHPILVQTRGFAVFCVYMCAYGIFVLFVYGTLCVFSVFWYCRLGLLTCKNRRPCFLYGVGGDVKPCSISQSIDYLVVLADNNSLSPTTHGPWKLSCNGPKLYEATALTDKRKKMNKNWYWEFGVCAYICPVWA